MTPAQIADVALFASTQRYGDLTIHAVLDVRRRFARSDLERAVQAVTQAFPVLGSRYAPGFWRDRWLPVDAPIADSVHVVDEPADLETETAAWVRRPLALTRDRPLRLVSLARGERSTLLLSVSHLAVDGAGMAAVGHVLAAHLYGAAPSAPVDARRTLASSLEGLRWYHVAVLARDVLASLLVPLRISFAAARERHFTAGATAEPSWRHVTIGAVDLERLKARGRPVGATVNDALIAALARISVGRTRRGPLAVIYTMDLRRYAGSPRLTAANTSSILSVVVPRAAVADPAATLAVVARLTARQRRSLVGPAFFVMPSAFGLVTPHAWVRLVTPWIHPLLIEPSLRRGLVFTNVGRLDEGLSAFGADLERVRIIGPNIAGVNAPVVVAFGLRGELHLQLFAAPGLAVAALDELETELRAGLAE